MVDTETELLLQRALDSVIAGRRRVTIAHRLSTIEDVDSIFVMDEERVVERGTHEELLAADGLYSRLWRVQVGQTDDLPQEFLDRFAGQADRLGVAPGGDERP